jgi:four helix bundle protein
VTERYGLSSQLRRAAVSIPSNIAVGQGRAHTREFLHHLSIARGSLQELETVLLIAKHRAYMTPEQLEHLLELCDHVSRMISVIRRKLSN